MFLIMTTDVHLLSSRRHQLVETHHTDSREDQDVHYSLHISKRCPLTMYHLAETHHTDSREDQVVHHGLHTLHAHRGTMSFTDSGMQSMLVR